MLRFLRTTISAGTFFGNIFFSGLPKIVEVHTTTGRRGKLWPADAGPEGGDYWSSCELEQFLESQRKRPSPESDSKNGFKDWNKNEKCIHFSDKNWAIETYFFSLNAKKVCKLKFYWASKIIKKIFFVFWDILLKPNLWRKNGKSGRFSFEMRLVFPWYKSHNISCGDFLGIITKNRGGNFFKIRKKPKYKQPYYDSTWMRAKI